MFKSEHKYPPPRRRQGRAAKKLVESGKPPSDSVVADKGDETRNVNGVAFPVVGIGASAGGLEALKQLFEHLSEDTGMAFVVIQHLAQAHTNILPKLLSRMTGMAIAEIKDGMKVKSNHV